MFMLAVAAAWLVAHASSLHGTALARPLLVIQFLLLRAVLVFCVTTKPSANPHGLMAGIAVMVAVCAMAFQYALMRLALPKVVSTAVMTGNLTKTVLSLMEVLSSKQPLMTADRGRLKRSLHLLIGFLVGCLVAAAAISMLGDWAFQLLWRPSRSRCDRNRNISFACRRERALTVRYKKSSGVPVA
jgi:uncharacterized membrane protein YoaK (UPF0700 family)